MKKITAIIGCGDVGLRIAKRLSQSKTNTKTLVPIVRTQESAAALLPHFENTVRIDFDNIETSGHPIFEHISELYYLVPPQKTGNLDERSEQCLQSLKKLNTKLERIVLISTTGVYGDCQGGIVTEKTPINPTTLRSQRRSNMEAQWQLFAKQKQCLLSILRVPGIYSHSRLPRKRLMEQAPIVDPKECGFTNRIHADDLAMICQKVMEQQSKTDIYNATDGVPGKMSQYFLDVAAYLDLPAPPVMSFAEAEAVITTEMMSYLRESRKISNKKLVESFNLNLKYQDYREGIRF